MSHAARIFRVSLWASLSLLVVTLMLVGWLLLTQSGGRWALQQVPGLQATGFEGTLAGRWSAASLLYDDGAGTIVKMTASVMEWRPVCFLEAALCVEELSAERVAVSLPPSQEPEEPESDSPMSLPEVRVPVSIQVAEMAIGRMTVNEVLVLDAARFAGDLSGSGLTIDHLSFTRESLQAQLSGSVELTGEWPVDARLGLAYRLSGSDYPGQLDLTSTVSGTVSKLALDASIRTPWKAHLAGVVRPLAPGYPVDVSLRSDRFRATPTLRETLILNQVVIRAQGDLNDGWRVEGSADMNTQPALPLSVTGDVDLQGADIERISLRDGPDRHLRIEGGAVAWTDGLSVSGSLAWSHFPWQRLMPGLNAPPVVLEKAGLTFALNGNSYRGDLDAWLSTPGGPLGLNTGLEGDFEGIRFDQLALASADGRVSGDATVAWRDRVSWDTRLQLAGLSPGRWLPELPGELSGLLRSKGSLDADGPRMDADLRLAGSLRGQAVWMKTRARMEGEQWRVPELELLFGDNRASARLEQAGALNASLDLDLPVLQQLWPGLEGRANAQLDASDLMGRPHGDLALQADSLVLDQPGLQIDELDGSISLEQALSGTGRVEWQGVQVSGQRIESGDLLVHGDREAHEIGLSVRHEMAMLRLSASGGWQDGHWRGRIDGGGVRAGAQHWLMGSSASLTVGAGGTVELGAHCWGWQDARLCAGQQRLYPDQKLDVALTGFPTRALAPWLPLDLRWHERFNAAAQISIREAGPSGSIRVDGGSGTVEVRRFVEEEDSEATWFPIVYDRLRAEASLRPGNAMLDWRFAGPTLGNAEGMLTINPERPDYPVDGHVTLEKLDLALIRPFLDLDIVAGRLHGEARLSGPLASPDVRGELRLEEGRVVDTRLPLAFEGVTLRTSIQGNRADIEGQWTSGEQGTGTVTGTASWGGTPTADLAFEGEQLPVSVEPFARLTVFPDLQVRYDQQELNIAGRVDVPRGDVTIKSLPESAVDVSDDQVIVGRESESRSMPLGMNLVIVIGEDRVNFNGFGVTGALAGRLRLEDDMRASGELNLREGRYELYGQDLTIRRAQLLFSGPLDRPFLDIEAVRTVGDVTAGIRLSGLADEPRSEIFSEPAMSQQQALSYLVLGRPLNSESESRAMENAAIGLGLAGAAPLTRKLGQKVGIEELQLEAEGEGEETSVVASGYVTDKLSLNYSVGIFEPVSRFALRYDLSQRLFLEAASGLASSLDIFYQREFGQPGD